MTIQSPGDRECRGAYVTFRWGRNLGRVVLDGDVMHEIRIDETALQSGWPSRRSEGKGGADDDVAAVWTFANGFLRDEIVGRLGSGPGFVWSMLTPSNRTAHTTYIWINSYVVVAQHDDGSMEFFTREGHPEISVDEGERVELTRGMALRIDPEGELSAPEPFSPPQIEAVLDAETPWCPGVESIAGIPCSKPSASVIRESKDRLEAMLGGIGIGLVVLSALGLAVALARR